MIISQWRDERAKTHRVYIQFTPAQAQRLIAFLQEQMEEAASAKELNERGVIELYHKSPKVENYKGLITFVIV